ncbi:MAG: hypothetical protein AAF587_42170 [Bacteroidota bacterium]
MKRIKQILLALLVLFALATTMTTTGCTSGKVCQAKKVGNHR